MLRNFKKILARPGTKLSLNTGQLFRLQLFVLSGGLILLQNIKIILPQKQIGSILLGFSTGGWLKTGLQHG